MDEVTKELRELKEENPNKFKEILLQLPVKELKTILYDWNLWARSSQLAPEGMWRIWMILAGRGFGKTRTGAEWIVQRAKEGKGPIALIGQTVADIRDTMIEVGESSILRICSPDFKPLYEPSKRRLTFPNGVTCTTFSGDEPEQLRGPQHRSVWIDELPKFSDPEECYTQMDLGLRIGNDAACIITTTPTPTKIIKDLYEAWKENPNGEIRITSGSTLDNAANLGASYIEAVKRRYAGTRLEKQEIFGEILFESENAYFKREDIDKYRILPKEQPHEYKRIIISVDPAITNHEKSDKHGIIVGAIGYDDHGYILADKTMKGTPAQWAATVAELYDFYNADIIVAEQNQGGLMVQHTIQSHQKNLPVKLVTATRGKIIRLEPIGLLFEQGRIHLVGNFPELEQQMLEYDGTQKYSPNNLDAFVWCMTEGMTGKQKFPAKSFEFHI